MVKAVRISQPAFVVPKARPSDLVIFSCSDSIYFMEHTVPLVASLDQNAPGSSIHLHLINPTREVMRALALLNRYAVSTTIGHSVERISLRGRNQDFRRTYHASIRFLRARQLTQLLPGRTLLTLDADSLIIDDLARLSRLDRADVYLRMRTRNEPDLRFAAGAVLFRATRAGARFLSTVASYIEESISSGDVRWYLDQRALARAFEIMTESDPQFRLAEIGGALNDWTFRSDSAIWAGKGERKTQNAAYVAKKESYSVRAMRSSRFLLWKVNAFDRSMASVRYRCIYPSVVLRNAGFDSVVLEGAEYPVDFELAGALIIVKSFEARDIALARAAAAAKVAVYFDLCDNIFVESYGGRRNREIRENFDAIARVCTGIITTTEALKAVIEKRSEANTPVSVVPDVIETRALIAASDSGSVRERGWRLRGGPGVSPDLWDARRRARRSRDLRSAIEAMDAGVSSLGASAVRFLEDWEELGLRFAVNQGLSGISTRRRPTGTRPAAGSEEDGKTRDNEGVKGETPGEGAIRVMSSGNGDLSDEVGRGTATSRKGEDRKTIIWFGHSGSPFGRYGLTLLADIGPAIEAVAKTLSLRLLVMSNDRPLFDKLIAPYSFPSKYMEWDPTSALAMIELADVCVVPNSRDEFSIVKSANRVVLSLSRGTPVVATRIPALEPLRSCIICDDFECGIRTYLCDPERRERDLKSASRILLDMYSPEAVSRSWSALIGPTIHSAFDER